MGTSGAFGGSQTGSWRKVAEALIESQGSGNAQATDGGDGDPGVVDPAPSAGDGDGDSSTTSTLAELIAQALQNDDPATKPRFAPAARAGDSGLSLGGLTGNSRRTGTLGAPPTSGRRQISAGAGRAGRAVGAGRALAAGNSAALREYGLDLSTLQGQSRVEQILAIMDAVEVGNAGPDDIALRASLIEVLDQVLDPGLNPTPEETMLEFVAQYATNLFAIELDALIQRGDLAPDARDQQLRDLSEVIRVDAGKLDVTGAVLTTPAQFEHAAQQLMRATLDVVVRRNR